jgi:hypothetical protein
MKPPKPPELAMNIISAVSSHVEFDLVPLRANLLERLEEPSEEYIWPRAERIVEDGIDSSWAPELLAQCEQALEKAHDEFLVSAAHCREASDDLQLNGRESWIAGAIRHHLAFETAWETLDERHGVEWHECGCECQSLE